jgi:hypothetical protein
MAHRSRPWDRMPAAGREPGRFLLTPDKGGHGQHNLAGKRNQRTGERNGTLERPAQSGAPKSSLAPFRCPGTPIADDRFVGCLWWRWRRRRHEQRHSRVGRRDESESRWISRLCRHCLGNVSAVPGCGTLHYLYGDRLGQRDVLLCSNGLRYVEQRKCILERNIEDSPLNGRLEDRQAAVNRKNPKIEPGAN